jgi:hypothetical protein
MNGFGTCRNAGDDAIAYYPIKYLRLFLLHYLLPFIEQTDIPDHENWCAGRHIHNGYRLYIQKL